MRFKVTEQFGDEYPDSPEVSDLKDMVFSEPVSFRKAPVTEESCYPTSVSIDLLLNAGQLIKPKMKNRVTLRLEKFNLEKQEWVSVENPLDLLVESEKFASGGFRDAFLGVSKDNEKWVVKKYHGKAANTITGTLNSTIEDHTRKQIQMHCAARHLTKVFSNKVPQEFGECFTFNRAYYTVYQGEPATVEEFVEGTFRKYVNNNGKVCRPEVC